MSNKTHIPKWDPRSSFGVPEPKRNGPKYNLRKRSLPDMDEKSCRTITDKSGKQSRDGVTWYQSLRRQQEDDKEPQQRREPRSIITNGRITRRVGMFRNAKQSSVVIGDLPSAVRRNAFREIERIVAPDDSAEFVGQSGEHVERRRDYIRENEADSRRFSRRDSRVEDERNGRRSIAEGLSRNQKRRREDDRFMDQRNDRFVTPESSVVSGNSRRGANDRMERAEPRGLYDSGYKPIERPRRSFHADNSDAPRIVRQTRRSQNSSGVSDVSEAVAVREQSQRTETSSALRRLLEKQERIIRTPGRDSTRDSTIQEDSITPIPYPSKKLTTRILAAMPRLSLRDDTDNRYAHAAQDLLFGSITQKEDSDDLMRTLLNRTSTLRFSDHAEHEGLRDQAHEHLFEPDVPLIEGLVSSSPPPTPELERQFNQTVRDQERFHTPLSHLDEDDDVAYSILSDGEDEQDEEGPADGTILSDQGFGSDYGVRDANATAGEGAHGSLSPFVHISPFAGNSFLQQLENAMNDSEPNNYDFNMNEPLF